MRYSDPMKLADLPPEHWARISPEAYARLLAEPPIEWLKRGGDGTFNETTATGLDNHSKVLIPWHEFYTKFEWECARALVLLPHTAIEPRTAACQASLSREPR